MKNNWGLIEKFCCVNTSEHEKMILVLKDLDNSIQRFSINWKMGYKKYIKKAIKLLENMEE